VSKISRVGTLSLRFTSGSSITGILALKVSNETFQVRVIDTNEKVRYEINSANEDRSIVEL
jgi:hypothetical protein